MDFSSMSAQKYLQVAKALEKRFTGEPEQAESFLPSENQISASFSVSRMTARRALRHLEAAGLIYSVPGKGRMLAGGARHDLVSRDASRRPITIGIYPCWAQQRNDVYFSDLLNGLWAGSASHPNIRGRLLNCAKLAGMAPGEFVAFVHQEGIDGLVNILASEADCPAMMAAQKAGIPVVTVNRTFPDTGLDWVSTDHRAAAFMLTEYLLQLGHRRILHVTHGNGHQFYALRLQGYREALEKHNILFDEDRIADIHDIALTEAELETWAQGKPAPTAVFVATGAMLFPTVLFLKSRGLKVPQDVSVVSFDEMPSPPDLPKITCMRQDVEKLGRLAVDILMRRLQNGRTPVLQMRVDATLVWGESVNPVKGK